MDPLLSTSEDEETVNSQIMNLAINGKLPENADLLDLGRKLKDNKQIKERPEEKMLTVDIIIVVISAENSEIPQALIDEIYKEANVKKKRKIAYFISQITRIRNLWFTCVVLQ